MAGPFRFPFLSVVGQRGGGDEAVGEKEEEEGGGNGI